MFRAHKLESNPMHILNPDIRVLFQVFAEAGDEHVETPSQEIVIFAPNRFQDGRSALNLIAFFGKESQQIGLFLGEPSFGDPRKMQEQIRIVEHITPNRNSPGG